MALPLPQLDWTSWAGLAAVAALIGGAWYRVQSFFRYVSSLVICRAGIREEAGRAVLSLMWSRGRRSPFAMRVFGGLRSFVRPKQRVEVIGYETIGHDPMLFWFGRVPVVMTKGGNGAADNDASAVSILFIRGTLDLDEFIEEAVTTYNQLTASVQTSTDTPRRRFNVHRVSKGQQMSNGWSGVELGKGESPVRGLNPSATIADPSDILKRLQHKELRLITWTPDDLIEQSSDAPPFDLYPFGDNPLSILPEIDTWLKHERWFRSKGVPWRRGYLATGLPGTGKSTFVRSVAIKYDLPIYVFDLASLDNSSFIAEWKGVQANTPAIVLLEDIDCVFKGREFVAQVSKNRDTLTFDCLLNTVSGVGSNDGILLFVTTNCLDALDPALGIPDDGKEVSTRPGRLDRVIHFGPMLEAQRRKLAAFILDAWPDLVEPTVLAGEGETAAQFQYRCSQLAEKQFWSGGAMSVQSPPPPERPARSRPVEWKIPTMAEVEEENTRRILRS